MKTLIVYYSLSGNNKILAKALQQKQPGCDLLQIEEKKKRTRWTIFIDRFFGRTPKIKSTSLNLKEYDQVILLAPIWIGKIATPLKAFIKAEKSNLTNYSFATFCGGTEGLREKVTAELTKLIKIPPAAYAQFTVEELIEPDKRNNPKHVLDYKVSIKDMEKLESKIERFLEVNQVTPV